MTGNTGLSKVAVGVADGMGDVAPRIGVALGTGVGGGWGAGGSQVCTSTIASVGLPGGGTNVVGVISGVGSGTIVSSVGVSAITVVMTASVTSGISVAQDTTSMCKITI